MVIDLVRCVGGLMIVLMQASREERDWHSHFGEIVMVAPIEYALASLSGSNVVVLSVRGGHVIEVIECELLITIVNPVDYLLQIVTADIGTNEQNFARLYQNMGRVRVGRLFILGAS